MTANELEKELQALDDRLTVVPNPNRAGLSNIFFDGKNYDLPVVSTNNIKDEIDMSYRYEFPNGTMARYWSKGEIVDRITDFIQKMKDGKILDAYAD